MVSVNTDRPDVTRPCGALPASCSLITSRAGPAKPLIAPPRCSACPAAAACRRLHAWLCAAALLPCGGRAAA